MGQERVESVGHFEMLWDCEFCDTKGLLAKSQRCCPECGGKQNSDKRYFPKEGEQVRVDGHKYEGADRYCPACNNPQGAAGKNCTNCGSPMDGSKEVKGVEIPVAPPPKKSRMWIVFVVLGIAAIVGIVLGVRHCNRTKEAASKVLAHSWQREVEIQEYSDVQHDKWRNEMPSDARLVTCRKETRSHKQVADGEECHEEKKDKKDGTFEIVKKCKPKYRSEPVEDDKCRYTVTEWHTVEKKASNGAGMTKTDPAGLPTGAGANTPGSRRVGPRHDVHYLDLDVVGVGKQRCEVSEAAWKKYADGTNAQVQVKVRTNNVDCDSL